MNKLIIFFIVILFLPFGTHNAQVKFKWLKDKPGKWIYKYNINEKSADEIQFRNNVGVIAEWFHQNIPLLSKPIGFDMSVYVSRGWDEHYRLSPSNYGLTGYIHFSFHLFAKDGTSWKAELPSESYYNYPNINRLAYYLGGPIGQFDYFDYMKHESKLEKAINEAASKLDEFMVILPFNKELYPGVHLYDVNGKANCIVVFNPERPDYLIPVTLRELTTAYLKYYSFFTKLEYEKMILDELKKEIANFSEDELDGPAYAGHPTNIVIRHSSDKRNLPIMRLNPEYWDKSLPPSAIQIMQFGYGQISEEEMNNHYEKFGYPINSQKLIDQINWKEVVKLIHKK